MHRASPHHSSISGGVSERLRAVTDARECAQQPVPSSSASHRGGSSLVAAIWQDFAHVMRAPPDPAAEEAALARHAGKHAQLGDGPLWWNSVAAQNHAAQSKPARVQSSSPPQQTFQGHLS